MSRFPNCHSPSDIFCFKEEKPVITNKILGNLSAQHPTGEIIPVVFAWFETEKKRIAKTAEDGTELGI